MMIAKTFLQYRRYAGLCLFVLLLTACASSTTPLRLYQGDKRADNDIVRLLLPYELDVVALDGKKLNTPFVPGGQYQLDLLPGEHELKVVYEEVWGPPGRGTLEVSDVFYFKLAAVAGNTYVFKHNGPYDLLNADTYHRASDIKIWIEQPSTGQPIYAAETHTYGGPLTRAIRQTVSSTAVGEIKTVSDTSQQGVVKTSPAVTAIPETQADVWAAQGKQKSSQEKALEQLKFWWNTANEEQRKAFQAWTWTSKANTK